VDEAWIAAIRDADGDHDERRERWFLVSGTGFAMPPR